MLIRAPLAMQKLWHQTCHRKGLGEGISFLQGTLRLQHLILPCFRRKLRLFCKIKCSKVFLTKSWNLCRMMLQVAHSHPTTVTCAPYCSVHHFGSYSFLLYLNSPLMAFQRWPKIQISLNHHFLKEATLLEFILTPRVSF